MAREEFVARVITQLGDEMGLGALALDEGGQLSLNVGEIPLTFSLTSEPVDMLWLHIGLGEIAADDRATLSFLLQYGHLLWFRNLMTIGLDDAGSRVYGYNSIPVVTLSIQHLAGLLEHMLLAAGEVRRRLRDRDFSIPADSTAPTGQQPLNYVRI
jgi:hypothetical protein